MIFTRLFPLFLALGPLAAQAKPTGCKAHKIKTVWHTAYVTADEPEESGSQHYPTMKIPHSSSAKESSASTKHGHPKSSSSSMTTEAAAAPTSSDGDSTSSSTKESSTSTKHGHPKSSSSSMTSEAASAPTSSDGDSSPTTSGDMFAEATKISVELDGQPTDLCGTDDKLKFDNKPWNMLNTMWNSDAMVGKQCSNYKSILQAEDGTEILVYDSVTDVECEDSTINTVKGASRMGLSPDLGVQLNQIKSIPVSAQWSRTTAQGETFKGSYHYDFVTNPNKGVSGNDKTSSEFMIFLQSFGDKVGVIGGADGPKTTFNMYDRTWKLYEGVNERIGVTVRTMLPDKDYDGEFQYDLAEWMNAMVDENYIEASDFLNIGNLGTEVFCGKSTQTNKSSFEVNLKD